MKLLKSSLIVLGAVAAGIGCYGAYEYSANLNGGYLMIAAPIVALSSAVLPFYAERAWQAKHRLKAILLALILLPAAATVFYAAAERVHVAKAGAEAERMAMRQAIGRVENAHQEAKAKTAKAEADAKLWRAKSRKACDAACLAKWDSEASAARSREAVALAAVTDVQAKATEESPLKAPIWLLPASLDLIAFIAIWTGLSLPGAAKPLPAPAKKARKAKASKPKKQQKAHGFAVIHGGKEML